MRGGPLDPGRDEARRWLSEELSGAEYAVQESWVRRAAAWVLDRVPDPDLPGRLPAWTSWAALLLVVVAVLAVLAFAARDRWRRTVLTVRSGGVLDDDEQLTASAYRDRARAALRAGDPEAALLDAYRAIAAGAGERTLLPVAPGRTAHEVALGLGQVFPGSAAGLTLAADRFDAVRYGGHRAGADQAEQTLALEERLRASRPVLDGAWS